MNTFSLEFKFVLYLFFFIQKIKWIGNTINIKFKEI